MVLLNCRESTRICSDVDDKGSECGSAGVDGIKSAMNGAPTAGGVRRLSIAREQTCFTKDESRRLERNVGRISVSKTEAHSR